MIADKIENRKRYFALGNGIEAGLKFIEENDIVSMPPGRYQVDGDMVFVLVQEYKTKEENETKLEGHRKYIDIQYIVSGSERIGYSNIANKESTESYDPERDIEFFSGDCSWIDLLPGTFCIFYPEDLHRPGVQISGECFVKKAVVKIRV